MTNAHRKMTVPLVTVFCGLAVLGLGALWVNLFETRAHGVGGSDETPTFQVNAATQQCQIAIHNAITQYAFRRSMHMNRCIAAIIECDQAATDAEAQDCRRLLVIPGEGLCAEGYLDSGLDTLGAGAALAVSGGVIPELLSIIAVTCASDLDGDGLIAVPDLLQLLGDWGLCPPATTPLLDQELLDFIARLQGPCFDTAGVDLADTFTGLGFSSNPADVFELVDRLNRRNNGAGCLGNEQVRTALPLSGNTLSVVLQFHGGCVVVDDGFVLDSPCLIDTDCGPIDGRCGKVARAFLPVAGFSPESCVGE